MKFFFTVFLLTIAVLSNPAPACASSSSSSSGAGPGVFGAVSDALNIVTSVPGVLLPWESQSEFRICQIRRFFCGTTGIVIVAFAIFCLGMLVIMNKIHWLVAIVFIVGIIIFIDAREVSQTFGKSVFVVLFIDNPMCDCKCNITMDTIFTDPATAVAEMATCLSSVGTGLNAPQ